MSFNSSLRRADRVSERGREWENEKAREGERERERERERGIERVRGGEREKEGERESEECFLNPSSSSSFLSKSMMARARFLNTRNAIL